MKFVIFGLSVSSSWGNGHATIWRGLIRELVNQHHTVVFFEKDVPYYSRNRDLCSMNGLKLFLYTDWRDIEDTVECFLRVCDVAIVTSYCPDALSASWMIYNYKSVKSIFYDLDTPVTLHNCKIGHQPAYIGDTLLSKYDLVLSYTGGEALVLLKSILKAKNVFPLYGCVDMRVHRPVQKTAHFLCTMSYLGTYSPDRHNAFIQFLINPALKVPSTRCIIGGAQYPPEYQLPENITHYEHISPSEHSTFYCSSDFTLNITRSTMASMGYCPSGRVFEAAACAVPIISDQWTGLDTFFTPGEEIVIAENTDDVLQAFTISIDERKQISQAAYNRVAKNHTAFHRVQSLLQIINDS